MHRKKYFPADLEPHPLHYAALLGKTDHIRKLIAAGSNCYKPIQDGETALHVAIAERQPEAAKLLVDEFRKDFELVWEHLVNKWECDAEDAFLLDRGILVAVGVDQCQEAKQLEVENSPIRSTNQAILVLLKNPIGGESVALLQSNTIDRVKLFKVIKSLLPNGLLSWNSTGPAGNCETLLQLAAYHGNAELVERLASLGADLYCSGPGNRTAFHSACEASQKEVITLFISRFVGMFDPTALDENQEHGLHYILNRKNTDCFKLVLDFMVEYRKLNFNEKHSDAFNFIFKLENNEWMYTSIWTQMDSSVWDAVIQDELELYQYDLSYQSGEVTVLIDMITYKKARRYYSAEIRKKPELLKISSRNGFTVLHALISANELELVKGVYENNPEMLAVFECGSATQTLASIMHHGYVQMMEMILENHGAFFQNTISEVHEKIIMPYSSSNYGQVFEVLVKHLPTVKPFVSKRMLELDELSYAANTEYEETFEKLLSDFPSAIVGISNAAKSLDDYNSHIGRSFLHQAIIENRVSLVEHLLDAGTNFEYLSVDGCHAVHQVKSVEMLRLLLAKHPDGPSLVNRKDRNGFTLLHLLCPNGSLSSKRNLILEVLRLGARIDARTNDQATVLFYTYDEELFTFFTKDIELDGFDAIEMDLRDFEGNTALHRHLRHLNSHISCVMLRAASTFVNFNTNGDSYLSYLIRFEQCIFESVIKPVLNERPEKTNEMFQAEFDKSRNQTSKLFVEACMQLNVYCIERFLQMDLDFSARDSQGMTGLLALLNSYELPKKDLVRRLLEKEVGINIQCKEGRNALMTLGWNFTQAKSKGYGVDMVKLMIERGVKLDEVDQRGESVLHYAFRRTELDLIEVLLQNGANFGLANRQGKLPYEVAPKDVSNVLKFLHLKQ